MKGVDGQGRPCELTAQQEAVVRCLLAWHQDGIQAALPSMGKGSGKTVIMATVVHYLRGGQEWTQASPPYATYRQDAAVRVIPEGILRVTDHWQAVTVTENGVPQVIGWQCARREAELDGEPVYYPRSQELAARAGIREPRLLEWTDGTEAADGAGADGSPASAGARAGR